MREAQMAAGLPVKYDGRYANLSREESDALVAQGKPFVIRMRVPSNGVCTIKDMLRGEVVIPWEQVDMQVLLKLTVCRLTILPMWLMTIWCKITHVLRGEEWLPFEHPSISCYSEYFGWQMPELCHMPLLRNPPINLSCLSVKINLHYLLSRCRHTPWGIDELSGSHGLQFAKWTRKIHPDEMIQSFDIQRISFGRSCLWYWKAILAQRWISADIIRWRPKK